MKYTNKLGVPEAFARAVTNDPYSKGESDFSATGLEQPPRAVQLIERFRDTLEVDVSSRVAVIIGQGSHSILERAARPGIDIIETRYFRKIEVDGVIYTVSAQIDLYESDTKTLSDWKTTKTYAFHKKSGAGKKPEWISQLNIGKWVCAPKLEIERLRIVGLLKDWMRQKLNEPGYPPSEVMSVDLPVWETEKVEDYIRSKIRAHVAARSKLPLCTTKETWGGNRCGQWCDAAPVCSQYQDSLKTGILLSKKSLDDQEVDEFLNKKAGGE